MCKKLGPAMQTNSADLCLKCSGLIVPGCCIGKLFLLVLLLHIELIQCLDCCFVVVKPDIKLLGLFRP